METILQQRRKRKGWHAEEEVAEEGVEEEGVTEELIKNTFI